MGTKNQDKNSTTGKKTPVVAIVLTAGMLEAYPELVEAKITEGASVLVIPATIEDFTQELTAELTTKVSELENKVKEKDDEIEILTTDLDQYTTGEKTIEDEYSHVPQVVMFEGKKYLKADVLKDKKILSHFKKS